MREKRGGGRQIIGPGFGGDDGSRDPAVGRAIDAYRDGRGGEHDVVAALAGARLLVPVVTVADMPDGPPEGGGREEKGAEMALPTLVGRDGRRAVIAFTGAETIAAWRADARPVPVRAPDVCAAALDEEAAAVLVDVAGPVPVTISGARLTALAAGEPPPPPERDPEVLAAVHAATREEPGVRRVRVTAAPDADLGVELEIAGAAGHEEAARRVAARLSAALGARVARGVAFTLTPVA